MPEGTDETARRQLLDTYLQGAHLALFAMEGRLREKGVLGQDDVEAVMDELHAMFSSARESLKQPGATPRIKALAPLAPQPVGKN